MNENGKTQRVAVVILAFNEEKHLGRCIESIKGFATEVLVVDCFSSDRTVAIARMYGARVVQKEWVNYAEQFNWALTQLDVATNWVFRLDADEVVSDALVKEIVEVLPKVDMDTHGFFCRRHMTFQGRLIRHGGIFPVRVLRLFRFGYGQCENRWMDEHIKVAGGTKELYGEIVDDNLQSLTWWTTKHNGYANREVVDLLNLQYGFMPHETIAELSAGNQAGVKRWIKEKLYVNLPGGIRAFLYFFYRYFLRLGFLDGAAGAKFHFLQGFWYRFLVDAKLAEVNRYMQESGLDAVTAIRDVLQINVRRN